MGDKIDGLIQYEYTTTMRRVDDNSHFSKPTVAKQHANPNF